MSARRPQQVPNCAPGDFAGSCRELSRAARSRRELSGAVRSQPGEPPPGAVKRRRELSGAARSRRELQEPARRAVRSRREPSGAARETLGAPDAVGSCREPRRRRELSGAASCREPPGDARAEILEGDVWGALKIEHYVLEP